jgi:hypothetical protein
MEFDQEQKKTSREQGREHQSRYMVNALADQLSQQYRSGNTPDPKDLARSIAKSELEQVKSQEGRPLHLNIKREQDSEFRKGQRDGIKDFANYYGVHVPDRSVNRRQDQERER